MRKFKHTKKRKSKYEGKFYVGQTIGRWTVIDDTLHDVKYGNNEYPQKCIKVKCDCGTERLVQAAKLLKSSTQSCGCNYVGLEKNPNWKGVGPIPGRYVTQVARGAAKRGLDFSLTANYMAQLWEKQTGSCALTGDPIYFGEAREYKDTTCASLDRIDNSKGYVEGNVQFVSKKVNFAKHKSSQEEFIEMCKKVAEKYK